MRILLLRTGCDPSVDALVQCYVRIKRAVGVALKHSGLLEFLQESLVHLVPLNLLNSGQVSYESRELCEMGYKGLISLAELAKFEYTRMYSFQVIVGLSDGVKEGVETFDVDVPAPFIDLVDDLLKSVPFQAVKSVAESGLFIRKYCFLTSEFVPKLYDPGTELD